MGANISQEEIISILSKIFLADLVNHQERIRNEKKRFVHYTTAESALNILKSEEIWLRNATLMNDYMEVIPIRCGYFRRRCR